MDSSARTPSLAACVQSQPAGAVTGYARLEGSPGESLGGGTFVEGERRSSGREQLSQIQRARFMSAMVDVAARHGIGYATVARVVAHAGVSRRTFYEQFIDREDCFLATFDQALERIAHAVVPAYQEPSKWPERVRSGLVALLLFFDREPALARLVIVEAFGAGPKVLERRRLLIDQVVAVIDREGRAAKSGEGPPALTGAGVVGGALSLIHARLAYPTTQSRHPTANSSLDSARNVYTPRADAHGSGDKSPLVELLNPLMSLIVAPYLGPVAARREFERPMPDLLSESLASDPLGSGDSGRQAGDPLRNLDIRLTYRTVRVLLAIGELAEQGAHPSNRQVADHAGIRDQGQVSKLLARLRQLGLVENAVQPRVKGEANGWGLTLRGDQVRASVSV